MELDALIGALRDPAAFPPPHAASIDVAQTHASAVFLVGDSAWKVTKPVNLGFLDFSTLDRLRNELQPPDEIPRAHRVRLVSSDREGWLDEAALAVLGRLLEAT